MFRFCIAVCIAVFWSGIALAEELAGPALEAANVIPDVPEQLPWWGEMLTRLLGQFPDINGWVIVGFVIISAVLNAAAAILKVVAAKTETDKDDKWLEMVNRLSVWAAQILEWINKPSVKGKPKDNVD
jgi:hypothetical protein